MAAPPLNTLAADPEIFPLEDCAKGEELKCMGYLNKEVRDRRSSTVWTT